MLHIARASSLAKTTFTKALVLPTLIQASYFFSSAMGGGLGKPTGPKYADLLAKTDFELSGLKEEATFAAGCFWGVELAYQRVPGVLSSKVGYTQGHVDNPAYEAVCRGTTGHAEAVHMVFDPKVVNYKDLVELLWERHDATTLNQQGNDVGTQYRSGIYYHSEEQRAIAEESKAAHEKVIGAPVVTEIKPATVFWDAEAYHQQYLEKGGQCSAKGDSSSIRCYG